VTRSGIGIVGTGISGLHAALLLQQQGVEATVYAERTPAQMRAGRLPNTVARFGRTRAREVALGLTWPEGPGVDCHSIHVTVAGEVPLGFRGDVRRPYAFLDFRIYLPGMLETYRSRGGRVVVGPIGASDVVALGERHDLVVVASGRETMTQLFPADPGRSPFTAPQRVLMAGIFRGLRPAEPSGITLNVAPGAGEIFHSPFQSFDGPTSNLLFEAAPGGPLEEAAALDRDHDPVGFDATILAALREHAPVIFERVDDAEFGLTRSLDLLQGAVTPVVRRAWAPLSRGAFAVAVGDAWITNDPLTGQGANLGSDCAEVLARAVADASAYDERFCRSLEAAMWAFAEPVVSWTNSFLQPPAPNVVDLIVAAASDQAVADAFADNFDDPAAMWRSLATPEGTAELLQRAAATDPRQP
jgi:2-polyprenyl-6-methoxyphenol hydroxylase-like FAD-dependent oxidoreductase